MSKSFFNSAILALALAGSGLGAVAGAAEAQRPEVFALAAESEALSGVLSELTGRAPYYHIYDIDGNLIEVLANPYLDLEFGIGPRAAALLADKQVTVLVGGMAGPKMQDVMDAKGIRFVYRKGTVQSVVDELRE